MSDNPARSGLIASFAYRAYCDELARWLDAGNDEAALRAASERFSDEARSLALAPEHMLIALTMSARPLTVPVRSASDREGRDRDRRYTQAVRALMTSYFMRAASPSACQLSLSTLPVRTIA